MALYKDGNPVSGLNSIPRLTLAQYNALNVKPEFWIRTDAPESYKKLSADQVSYDSNNTVKDKIDSIELKRIDKTYTGIVITSANQYVKISDYSDLPFTQSTLISFVFKGYSPNCIYQLQCYSDGIYLYSNTTVTNGNVHLFFTYREE